VNDNRGYGIYIYQSLNSQIINNNIRDNGNDGIFLYNGVSSKIINNKVISNSVDGVFLGSYSENSEIKNNEIISNSGYGVYLYNSKESEIAHNNIDSNKDGIYLSSSGDSKITNNIVSGSDNNGIYLVRSPNNIITDNNVTYSKNYGIYLKSGSGLNDIYHNCFIDNGKQAEEYGSSNTFDGGPEIGGNYWSDHVCTGDPSNGSQPYVIPPYGHKDRYPFENVRGWVLTMPAVSITTDKMEYSPGDTMNITLGFYNPVNSTVKTYFVWYLRVPEYGYEWTIMVVPLTLPAEFELLYNVSMQIGDWGAAGFNATWDVALLETTPPYETISEDSADWKYVPVAGAEIGKGEVKPAEIGEEIKTKLNEEVALTK